MRKSGLLQDQLLPQSCKTCPVNIIVAGIIACEIGFWIVLGLGLATRYLLRARKLSTILLACVPLLDVALLSFIVWDLAGNEATAEAAHGLGALYLGITVAFGHSIIAWADGWFSYRFAGGPRPQKPPKSGRAYVEYEWREWGKMLLCAVITSAVILLIMLLVGYSPRTEALAWWIPRVWMVTGIWLVGWPVWASIQYGTRQRQPQ